MPNAFSFCTFENVPQLFTLNADSIYIENCSFSENECIGTLLTDSYLNVKHSFIRSSEITRPIISLFENSALCISESVFDHSGEIFISDSSIVNIDHSIFKNMNKSLSVADSGTLNLNNNLFLNNDIGLFAMSTYDEYTFSQMLYSDLKVFNNLFIDNNIAVTADIQGAFHYYGTPLIKYNDFWNNTSDFGFVFIHHIRSINSYNGNGDPSDMYYNIFFDPQLDDDLHLTWDSPCINAGNPNSPQDPDATIADIGLFFFDLSTQIEELSQNIIHVNSYPNPASDIINFDIASNMNISGTAVLNITSISLSLRSRGINAGLYVYTLIVPGQDATSGKITVDN